MSTIGFLSLIVFLIYRTGWLNPPLVFPISLALIAIVGPLMFPLRGMLHGRLYTYGWSMFLSLLYFTIGVVYAANPEGRWQGLLVILLSGMWFAGAVIYVRQEGKAGRKFEPHDPDLQSKK